MKINGKPDGGGREPIVESLSVTSNGIYTPSTGVDGFDEVDVDVPSRIPVFELLSATENGTYTPGEGVDGFNDVTIDVSTVQQGYTMKDILQTGLTKSILSDSTITAVASYAVAYNSNIQTVNLPNCTNIYGRAFMSCSNLKSVMLPICSKIDIYAFAYCSRLKYVYLLSDNVVTINNTAFSTNTSMSIFVTAELLNSYLTNNNWSYYSSMIFPNLPYLSYSDGVVFGSASSLSSGYYTELGIAVGDITSLSFPMLTSVDSSTFKNHYNLSAMSLPVLSVYPDSLFYGCSDISSFTLYYPITALGNSVFANCTGLTEVTITGNNITTGTGTFDGCINLSVIKITDDYYKTAPGWSEYSSLMVITMPELAYSDGLVYGSISELTSSYLTRLGITSNSVISVSLPYCKSIGTKTFLEHHALKDVYLPQCEYLASSAFYGANYINGFELPVCSYIGDCCFYWCYYSMSYLTLGYSGVCTNGGNNTFANTNALRSIYVPASLVDAYKAAYYWSGMSSKIKPIE